MNEVTRRKFGAFLVGLTVLCLVVVLWGAFVRFSHSGDGCGASWPLCDGSLVPQKHEVAIWIEYTHRVTSGLFGLGVFIAWVLGLYLTKKGDPLRKFLLGVLLFTISEALIGAGLVLRELVAQNDSVERALWLVGHLLNTLILFYLLVGSALQVYMKNEVLPLLPRLRFSLPLVCFLLLALAGSLASLSTSLYPSSSLQSGLMSDFSEHSPLLVRLRIIHPLLGILFFGGLITVWYSLVARFSSYSIFFLCLAGANILVGSLTLLTLSPLAGRLLHLLLADLLWVQLVIGALLLSAREKGSTDVKVALPGAVPISK